MHKFKVRFWSNDTKHFHTMEVESNGDKEKNVRAAIKRKVQQHYEGFSGIKLLWYNPI